MRTFAGLLAIALLGCSMDADVEDGRDDVFLTDDAKADAFGVEDWSPDGAAVLKLVSTASRDKLDDDVGLSSRAAAAILTQRGDLGGTFQDLADLDATPYIGKASFNQLLRYVTEHHLYKTSLRVPLLVENDAQMLTSITTYNAAAHSAGLTGFARYTFVDTNTDFDAKMTSYNDRLMEVATKANITIDGEMFMYAYSYSDFTLGSQHICYIGNGDEVGDLLAAQAGVMVGEMYNIWAWRHGERKFTEDDGDDQYGDEFNDYDTDSDDVLVVYSNSDGGDTSSTDTIPRCR
jgi:hypothetical protein